MANMTNARITEIVNANFPTEEAFVAFLQKGALSLTVSALDIAKKLTDAETAAFVQAQESKKNALTTQQNAAATQLAAIIASEAE